MSRFAVQQANSARYQPDPGLTLSQCSSLLSLLFEGFRVSQPASLLCHIQSIYEKTKQRDSSRLFKAERDSPWLKSFISQWALEDRKNEHSLQLFRGCEDAFISCQVTPGAIVYKAKQCRSIMCSQDSQIKFHDSTEHPEQARRKQPFSWPTAIDRFWLHQRTPFHQHIPKSSTAWERWSELFCCKH